MTRGRPPSWNFLADVDPQAWTDVVPVSSKERLNLPVSVRKRVPWIGAATVDGLVAVLEPSGGTELLAWSPSGERIRAVIADRLKDAPPNERGEMAIAAMDRYVRMSVEQPARIVLGAILTASLDPGGRGAVRVVVRSGRLWLWSEANWQSGRADRLGALGLPAIQVA